VSDYVWFKLLVRAIGILLLALALPKILDVLYWAVEYWAYGTQVYSTRGFIASLAFAAVDTAIAMYLVFGGRKLIEFCMLDLNDRCPRCGYSVSGLAGSACPECGTRLAGRSAPRASDTSSNSPPAGE
jgi:hypothetical protein